MASGGLGHQRVTGTVVIAGLPELGVAPAESMRGQQRHDQRLGRAVAGGRGHDDLYWTATGGPWLTFGPPACSWRARPTCCFSNSAGPAPGWYTGVVDRRHRRHHRCAAPTTRP
jgi:hypothetical protein